jgi:hypothetical protein
MRFQPVPQRPLLTRPRRILPLTPARSIEEITDRRNVAA